MKKFKVMVEIYVHAEDVIEASNVVFDELNYVCELDNNMMAFSFDDEDIEEQEETQV